MALQPAAWEWPVRQLRLEVPLQDSVPDPGESFLLLCMNLRFPREHAQGGEPGEGGLRSAGISQFQLGVSGLWRHGVLYAWLTGR